MPHVEGHIEEPQVQGDPQGVDYNAIFEGYYSEGYNEKQAKRMLRATYGAEGKTQFDSLGDFYKKKSQVGQEDPSGSEPSAEADSGVSTSTTTTQGEPENGDSDSPAAELEYHAGKKTPALRKDLTIEELNKIDPVEIEKTPRPKNHYELGVAEVITRRRPDAAYWEEDYLKKFGGDKVWQLNTSRILNKQVDRQLMFQLKALEKDAFTRWFDKYKSENKQYVDQYLAIPLGEDLEALSKIGSIISPFEYRDKIFEMVGDIEGLRSTGQLTFPDIVPRYMEDPGAYGISKKDQKGFIKEAESNWGNFYRDMVKESLPYSIQQSEDDLKAMEYYFKTGADDLFDFNEDGEIGWQNWLGQAVLKGESGIMNATSKIVWTFANIAGWVSDAFVGGGSGDMFTEGLEAPLRVREKELERIQKEINSYERGIWKSTQAWVGSGFTDGQAFGDIFEQSFNMILEGAPTLTAAVGVGVATKSPMAAALLMTADATAQRSMTIRNDITFDKFIPKETHAQLTQLEEQRDQLQKLTDSLDIEVDQEKIKDFNDQIRNVNGDIREIRSERYDYYSAISTIFIKPDDTMEEIQALLEEKFVMERDDSSRGQYIYWSGAIDLATDLTIFRIFKKSMVAAKFDPLDAGVRDLVKQSAKGLGFPLANASIPTFISAYNDEFQRAVATGAEFDDKAAFNNAMDVTLGMIGVGPTLHTAGTSLAYSRAVGLRTPGPDGINVLQNRAIDQMLKRSKDKNVSSKDRTAALNMWHKFKTEQIATRERTGAFMEYMGRQDPAAHAEITNLDLRMLRLMRTFESVDDPNLKMLVRQELSTLISDQQTLFNQFKEGFDAVYPHSTLRPKTTPDPSAKDAPKAKAADDAEEVTTIEEDSVKDPSSDGGAVGKKLAGDDSEGGIKGEDKEITKVGEGLLGWKLFRNTFRSDSGMGGQRGWNPFRAKKGKRGEVSETVRQQQREGTLIQEQLMLDLNTIDGVRSSVRFDIDGKKVGDAEFKQRQAEIDKYLHGEEARVAFLNNDQKAALKYLRGRVDSQTSRLINLLKKNPTDKNLALIETLEANQGQYLRRSYEAFSDDGSWIKKLADPKRKGKFKDLYDNALEYLMVAGNKKQTGWSGRELDAEGNVIKEGDPVYSTEAMSRDKAEALLNNYVRDLNQRMEDGDIQAGGGILGALDSRMLRGRKDIPEPFRNLLGEIDDVSYNYTNTMWRTSNYVADLTFHNILREQLIDPELGLAMTKDMSPPSNWVKLDAGKAYSGLDGLWVDPIFKDMFDSMKPLGPPQGKWNPRKAEFSFGGLQRSILKFQSSVKIGKTVLSPFTTVRNFLSGVALSLNAGKFSFTNPKDWNNAARLAWGTDAPSKTQLGQQRDMLLQNGVIKDGARGGEMLSLLRDFDDATQAQKIAKNNKQKNRLDKKIEDLTQKAYAFGDDFYKVLHFYEEYNGLKKSGMSDAEAKELAGVRTRGSMPTYSYVSRNVKMLRGFPVTGTFVSFPYEVSRTTANNLMYMGEDYTAGRTQMAMKRALGMMLANGGVYAASKETMNMFGFTEEHVESIKESGMDYLENALPIFMGKEDGIPKFFMAESIFPSEEIMKPIRMIFSGEDPTDVVKEYLDAYIAPDITAQWANQVFQNKKELTGQPIYNFDEDKGLMENIRDNAPEIISWSMNEIGPGGYQVFREWARAMDIAPEWFGEHETASKEMNLEDLLCSALGARPQMIEPTQMLMGQVYEEMAKLDKYEGFEFNNRNLRLWETQDLDFLETQANTYVDKQMKVNKRLNAKVEVSLKLEASDKQIIKTLIDSRITSENATILLQNGLQGTDDALMPAYLSESKIGSMIKSIERIHKGNTVELKRRKAAALEAMELFNRFVKERWLQLNSKPENNE